MDANTMRARFNLQYEASRLGNRTFNDREIADFINKAQLQLVKTRFDALKNRTQRGFADGGIRGDELEGLLSATRTISNKAFIQGTRFNGALRGPDHDGTTYNQGQHNYGVFCQLPDECLYVVNEMVNTSTNPSGTGVGVITKYNVPVLNVNYTEYNSRILDFYAKPYDNLAWSMGWGNFTASEYSEYSSEADNRDAPYNVAVDNSTKDFTLKNQDYNIKGISPQSWGPNSTGDPDNDSLDSATETWVSFNSRRSRYLIPGKDFHILEYQVNYILTPPDVFIDVITPTRQVNCVLADFLHQEIVDLAVKLASAAIIPEQGKYQVNSAETQVNE